MNAEEIRQVETEQRQHHELMLFQSNISVAVEAEELNRFNLLKPKLYQDGNQWCVLYGKNVQEGIAGFGDTPNKAIFAWNAAWDKQI